MQNTSVAPTIQKFSDLCHFTAKQKEADEALKKYKYILYGGAAGGGKSYWLRWVLLKALLKFYKVYGLEGVTVGLFCEDYPSLRDRHLNKIRFEFPAWLGKFSSQDHNFKLNKEFGSGMIAFRNLDDVSKYLSAEFAIIAVDELTTNKKEIFDFLRTRLRWTGIEETKFIAGSNPGGIGHDWVKRIWIERQFDPNEKEAEKFFFIPAKVLDNPYVSQSYVDSLQSAPEKMRKAYLEGDWDMFEGQFFTEFNKEKHVIEPYDIPYGWKKFRTIDVGGKNGITCCYWCALDYDGNVIVYREYYGTQRDAEEHAKVILELSGVEDISYTVIDNSAYSKIGIPETIAEVYAREGIMNLIPSSKKSLDGWDTMHRYLRWDEATPPKMKFFNTCVNAIRTIPSLIHDKFHTEDLDTNGEDHAADSLRYLLQTFRDGYTPRPKTAAERRLEELKKLRDED
jgi:phage terminase large subunit